MSPRRRFPHELALALALGLFALVLALAAPGFFTAANLANLAADNLALWVAATGMLVVILAGEIDVSIGAQFAAAGVLAGLLAKLGLPLGLVALLVVLAGAAFGALQGLLVARGLPAVVVTLASLAILRGLLRWSTGGRWIADLPAGFQWLGIGQARAEVVLAAGALALVLSTALVLRAWHGGRAVYALGCDAESARRIGIRPARVRTGVFAGMGGFAAAAALFSCVRYPAIEIEAGAGLELQAIACVVLGGAAVRGGRGTVLGTSLGVALFGVLGTALFFLGVEAAWERAVQGAVILFAIVPEALRARRSRR